MFKPLTFPFSKAVNLHNPVGDQSSGPLRASPVNEGTMRVWCMIVTVDAIGLFVEMNRAGDTSMTELIKITTTLTLGVIRVNGVTSFTPSFYTIVVISVVGKA